MTRHCALMLLIATRAWACSCSGNWPSVKQAWESAPAVFLGIVEIADPDQDPAQTVFQNQYVRIRVDETFKGVFKGQTIELRQGASDCDAKFRTGDRGVFYLYPGSAATSWSVPACSYSLGSAEPDGDDLLFLRGLPASATGTRLSGGVELYEDSSTQAFKRIGGVPNVKVKIAGPKEFTQEAVTNAAGVYQVFGLQPGRYSVSIEVPKGLKIAFPVVTGSPPIKGKETAIELVSNGGASVGFVLRADTRLSGRILDAKGASLKDVCIDLEPAEGRSENGSRFFDCSKEDGSYAMEMMPSGKYLLVAHDTVSVASIKSISTLYYPGVRDRERAIPISIEAGNYLKHLEIRLPSDEKRYKIAGKFQFEDGAPVPLARVTFISRVF